mmetsp:Transcript_48646/g.128685  ORF Transcript_48646/g.128685 Transcript_48646/m.128685 type:complete len:221 (-) Transcript_48646:717-1379(-)
MHGQNHGAHAHGSKKRQNHCCCNHEIAAIHAVNEKGAMQYMAKITAANTCLPCAPAASSAMTAKLFAVGVQVTIIATAAVLSKVCGEAEPSGVIRNVPSKHRNAKAGVTTIFASVAATAEDHGKALRSGRLLKLLPNTNMFTGTAACPTVVSPVKMNCSGASELKSLVSISNPRTGGIRPRPSPNREAQTGGTTSFLAPSTTRLKTLTRVVAIPSCSDSA